MRMAKSIVAVFLVLISTPLVKAEDQPGTRWDGQKSRSLPDSLTAFYPPSAGQPVYLFKMLGMDTSFSGIVVDLMEDDIEGARGSFEEFKKRYREASEMVPEWKWGYPDGPVKDLGVALAAGDKALAMDAFSAVGDICHRCHLATMVPVQQRYRWGDWRAITVKDPLTGASIEYTKFKKFMAVNLAGITVDLRQGQIDNARKQFQGFKARFQALGESCGGCHEVNSMYFVGREVQDTLDKIGKAFESRTVVADEVTTLTQKIGRESCSKCHLVHVPAALAGGSRR